LEERQVSVEHVVKVHHRIRPVLVERQTVRLVEDCRVVDVSIRFGVLAVGELADEQLNSDDGEYQPEDQTHEQHIENGRNCLHKCVDHHLQ
jgi:hypothetical protein